ncbi:protein FAR1-RELATED SEQUENCE 4-like isoform X2 [Zingiber officinale]|uniref:protein FAR1-RELATED SEQUENCE 4-like isoform X2 n=1 Tax=Zingiber officinale TaxID=94328 RepID=UPI001C4CB54A|nr:protein FAR1-RELATED SEQUENCE 4-like isoform X2 [Zingiber officinale]
MVHISEITDGAAASAKEDEKDVSETLLAAVHTSVEQDSSTHGLEQPPPQVQEPASPFEQNEPPPLPLLLPPQETPLEPDEAVRPPPLEPEPELAPASVCPSASVPLDSSQIVAPAPATASSDVKVPYNEYALRVAYIMRSYLNMRSSGAAADFASAGSNGESCCRAMMEVTRKENGRWGVSKVETEHTHLLDPPQDLASTLATGGLVPVLGMEFDSISAAKQYYSAYSEKMGFQSKTGSGKKSRGTRLLLMQRFLCSKGHFPTYVNAAENATRKRKRILNKKVAKKEAKEVKTDCDMLEAIEVENLVEKDSMALEDQRGEIDAEKAPSGSGNDKGKGKNCGKVPLVSNSGQSRLLRELGIRVSRYTNEERRNIILKYMQKRSGRQAVDRSIKIPSRQALAERRQRGVGGKFLSREETQTMSRQEETLDEEPELPAEVVANAGGIPIVGMVFENEDKAYDYYIKYAGSVGFSVRKGWWDKSARNVTRSRVYVCSREGFRPKNETRRPRAETRTGCPACMAIKLTSSGKYRVMEFVADHNHQLAAPLDMQMLSSKKMLTNVQPSGRQNASIIPVGYKNYIRVKRSKAVQLGDTGALFEYFQRMKGDNPSFFYAIQVDEYDQMTNVFWADAKSMMDYHYFGDAVCFDTSYRANEYGRPLALFIGINHHRHVVIFAAAFLYDESVESFKWLFETFKTAMCGKQPHTIFIDQCLAISDAITATWPGTVQHLCVWQIFQNATKQLADVFEGSENFAHDFEQCIYYDFEDEDEFHLAWKLMLEKYDLKDNEWLTKLYQEKENWSSPYGRQTFSADIKSALRAENFGSYLKEHLNLEKDLRSFLEIYELLLEQRRYNELQADYNANQPHPRIPPLRLLWQAANAYTPAVYDIFRREVELFLDSMVYCSGEAGILFQYEVTVKEKSKVHCVRFDSSNGSIICSCGKLESVGIPCCHVLKVLDLRNIKELPPQYILKRWRKDAKVGNLNENHGITLDSDSKSSVSKRYSSLCRTLFKLAARAAENEEAFTLMVNHSDQLLDEVEQILQARLLEKPAISGTSKGHPHNLIDSRNSSHGTGNDPQKPSGKKKSNGGTRRRNENEVELNKRQKARKEVSARDNETHVPPNSISSQPRNPGNQFLVPNQFMQGPFVAPHQFGVGAMQGYPMSQFGQDSSASTLPQQPFTNSSHFTQGFPTPDLQALQFIGNNAQLDHQSNDQGQCAIPVWDFLSERFSVRDVVNELHILVEGLKLGMVLLTSHPFIECNIPSA